MECQTVLLQGQKVWVKLTEAEEEEVVCGDAIVGSHIPQSICHELVHHGDGPGLPGYDLLHRPLSLAHLQSPTSLGECG